MASGTHAADACSKSYTYGNRRITMSTGSSPYYFHYDALGSVVNVTSSSGATEWTDAYDPFGTVHSETKNDTKAPTNVMKFAGEDVDGDRYYAIWLTAANTPQFEVGAGSGNKFAVITSSTAITDTSSWHHVVGTFASGVLKIYLDGLLVGTNSSAGFTTVTTNTSAFNISLNNATNYFGGSLDEVAVYGTALTAAQISDHHNKAITAPTGTVTTPNYSYDTDGHQTQAGSSTFGFNVADQLTQTIIAGTTTSYGYDGDGKRLTSTSAGTTNNYLWDTNNSLPQLALEQTSSGSLTRRYINGLAPISLATPAGSFYYHEDAYGSTADLTNAGGATQWAYTYDPYGTPRTPPTKVDPNAPTNPLQFDSQYTDGNNLYNLRAGGYDTTTGRFLQTDPIPQALTDPYVDAYAYANNQPTLFDDPSGQCLDPLKFYCAEFSLMVGTGQALATMGGAAGENIIHPRRAGGRLYEPVGCANIEEGVIDLPGRPAKQHALRRGPDRRSPRGRRVTRGVAVRLNAWSHRFESFTAWIGKVQSRWQRRRRKAQSVAQASKIAGVPPGQSRRMGW